MKRLTIVDPRSFGSVSDAEVIPLRALSALQTASYDVLINTIPTAPPIKPITGCVVMDIVVSNQKRPLLIAAEKSDCVIIEGIEMFIHQAIGQFMWWFHET